MHARSDNRRSSSLTLALGVVLVIAVIVLMAASVGIVPAVLGAAAITAGVLATDHRQRTATQRHRSAPRH
jgi:uncharacterized membrane protein HdeD (DUF308 family)